MVVMDWLAKLLQLPEDFLSTGKGGGVIQVYHSHLPYCSPLRTIEIASTVSRYILITS